MSWPVVLDRQMTIVEFLEHGNPFAQLLLPPEKNTPPYGMTDDAWWAAKDKLRARGLYVQNTLQGPKLVYNRKKR